MSHTKLSPFIVKVSVLGYFPLHINIVSITVLNIVVQLYIMTTFRLLSKIPPPRSKITE